ncbi:MAG: DinB family protein [Chitinophagaceae bacterium]|nr:DinB family protein [Chitinophagaceae bacterium]MBP6589709.1 DinB family protein [Chitinophagaceae bacterium]MBP8244707.1 DinB family protein [Chitinophagaceae bacterium]
MNKEIQSIAKRIANVISGEPWFGESILSLLREIDPSKTGLKPPGASHNMKALLWHMNTWATFILDRIEKKPFDPDALALNDWRTLQPRTHTWENGMIRFQKIHQKIISRLQKIKDDQWLLEKVEGRNYDFAFLLNGLTEHAIYHTGQIVLLNKMLR